MAQQVRVLVFRTAGTNCNEETAFAFARFGATVDQVHIKQVVEKPLMLRDYHILAFPGGFSYGDDIASGRILANELRLKLGEEIKRFIADGKLVIGICNGFQVLTKAGILPGLGFVSNGQESTLFHNDSAKFESRWTYLNVEGKSVWTNGMTGKIYLPVAHGEGKFVPLNADVLKAINTNGQVVFRYTTLDGTSPSYPDNPNGSTEDIAGITDPTGRVLGLMPHPERHFLFEQHPHWTRLPKGQVYGDGAKIFENGVNYVKANL